MARTRIPRPPPAELDFHKVLVINSALTVEQTTALTHGTIVTTLGLDGVTSTFLRQEMPDCILAPLMIGVLDILDIAERLVDLGYRGFLLAVAPPLPDKSVIRREVQTRFPCITFDVIEASAI